MKKVILIALSLLIGITFTPTLVDAADKKAPQKKKAPKKRRPPRPQTVGPRVNENKATPIDRISALKGFKVELIYTVPGENEGSWVNLGLDNKGRIIASDQYGGLYRFTPPVPGATLSPGDIEKIPANIRAVNGILWAFDALYVAVNDYERKIDSGVYRITDSNGDDKLDKVEKLRAMKASGDHGVHALMLSPDGKKITLITGNNTETTAFNSSRVPTTWGEDHLLPRMPDGRGHNRGRLGPAGIIYNMSPDGKEWEIISSGYRNIFDGAYNRDGELFTYDADMEYDFNTPWYRPTRVNHVTSGSMYGWRNGTGKFPEFYPDNLPPVINIGPGSPTGVTFGYGAKFPTKYQRALYILDWSWGKIYAVHMKPDGSTYKATKETFITGGPLPVTDAIIHPKDGAMYFAIGGRRVQSGLYRVTYNEADSTMPARHKPVTNPLVELRHDLESYHVIKHPNAVAKAWPHLDHPDRFVRWAAYIAIQHQRLDLWAERALKEADHGKRVTALLALSKATGIDPFHRKADDPKVDFHMRGRLLKSLGQVDWKKLNDEQRVTLVRAYEIVLNRFGTPDDNSVKAIIAQLDPHFPAPSFQLNWVLCETLAFLQGPSVAAKGIKLLQQAATQEEQMEYARSLRMLKTGWNTQLRTAYFDWFLKASNYRGGASFAKFIEFIQNDAVASLSDAERAELKDVLARKPVVKSPFEVMSEMMAGREYVKDWKLDELSAATRKGMKNRNFETGHKMFAAGGCFACHRFGNQGGMTGPDLTGSGGRYSAHDLLDQIVNPSKEINEQFVPIVLTQTDGVTHTGVVVNLNGDGVTVNTDMFDPNQRVTVDRKKVKSIEPSKISPMPSGLLSLMKKNEVLDLVAYILSAGDKDNPMFKK
ncbi:MAG: heme-binding protein [Verrucomicrobiia bacterium]|jgi:putative heme-binding domain-containing protein